MSGEAVFWTGADWSPEASDALVLADAETQQTALDAALAREDVVVGPYLAAVSEDGGALVRLRETIRTLGPTIRTDLGKQAEAQAA
ncbi:MAG: DUF2849 domain-containing protein [Pseudomonadota bacterium]